MTLIATPGSPEANSYVTVADAAELLSDRLHTEPWFLSEPTDAFLRTEKREAALRWATRLLNEQVDWYGTPSTLTQALPWPQTGQVDVRGQSLPTDVVPSAIQQATALYALALLRDTSETPSAAAEALVKRRRLGATEVEYFTTARTVPPARQIPAEIRQMLRPYGFVRGGAAIPVFRT